jgi:hypothetical protein
LPAPDHHEQGGLHWHFRRQLPPHEPRQGSF